MRDPIAERKLVYKERAEEPDEIVTVRIGRPALSAAHPPLWETEYEIDGPRGKHYESRAYGADAFQALGLVFPLISACLYAIHQDGVLTWDGAVVGTRFPT